MKCTRHENERNHEHASLKLCPRSVFVVVFKEISSAGRVCGGTKFNVSLSVVTRLSVWIEHFRFLLSISAYFNDFVSALVLIYTMI